MTADLLDRARSGQPVYICEVRERFAALPEDTRARIVLRVAPIEGDGHVNYELAVPRPAGLSAEALGFVREYVQAVVYNILSSAGGRSLVFHFDRSDAALVQLIEATCRVFCVASIRRERSAYGRAVNVIDRMLAAVVPGAPAFSFGQADIASLPPGPALPSRRPADILASFRSCIAGLEGRAYCGIDVGGTDIKAVLVRDGRVVDYKEYDWFPASFTRSSQLVEPIVLIGRLMLARLWIERYTGNHERKAAFLEAASRALDKHAGDAVMASVLADLQAAGLPEAGTFDGIGLCFPDVVVADKIVGGEVYKTRGIRNNLSIDYEADFAELTHLDDRLRPLVTAGGTVGIINDGPMAAFTAAVEMAAGPEAPSVADGVFAHTLGTELGTGWITEDGSIPDIPLEVYNFVVDLGSWPERAFEPDDVRSVNNFNTGIPGTLQKYCSQSGVFRLACKYFPSERPDLWRELLDKGYVVRRAGPDGEGWYVPTEPVDQRKPFLEHMMRLPEREGDPVNQRIWREIGASLAATTLETRQILNPCNDLRFLFGRLVKNDTCFRLIAEGACALDSATRLMVAGTSMANTPLMKQLERHPQYTVAQFAQAIGAVYFAHRGNQEKDPS